MQTKPRVGLDTNLIVSGLISPTGTPNQLLGLWEQGSMLLLTSSEFLAAVENVLHRGDSIKQRYRLTEERISDLLTSLKRVPTPYYRRDQHLAQSLLLVKRCTILRY